ncbi:MAG: polysaccharide deacetylase family protein [Armatimonadetes bacterium]|nr:polysaccharide deacetylase family protein [Armatimonadota bacterium]
MPRLLLSFDVERIPGVNPPDDFSRRLLGYVVDEKVTVGFLQALRRVVHEEDAPVSLFIAGMNLETFADAYGPLLSDPHFDLQQHGYSHEPFKCIAEERDDEARTRVLRLPLQPQAIYEDVLRTELIFRKIIGRKPIGLTAPFAYWRGLADAPAVLEILADLGYAFVRSYGRTATDYQPLATEQAQPFIYDIQGFPQIMEIPITGWHDVGFKTRMGWDQPQRFADYVCAQLDRLAGSQLTWSLLQHDWSSVQYDAELSVTRRIIRHARKAGWELLSHSRFYCLNVGKVPGYRTGLIR